MCSLCPRVHIGERYDTEIRFITLLLQTDWYKSKTGVRESACENTFIENTFIENTFIGTSMDTTEKLYIGIYRDKAKLAFVRVCARTHL